MLSLLIFSAPGRPGVKRKGDNMGKKKSPGLLWGIILAVLFIAAIILFVRKNEKELVPSQLPEQQLEQQVEQQPVGAAADKTPEVNREEAGDLPQAEDNQFSTENGKFLQ